MRSFICNSFKSTETNGITMATILLKRVGQNFKVPGRNVGSLAQIMSQSKFVILLRDFNQSIIMRSLFATRPQIQEKHRRGTPPGYILSYCLTKISIRAKRSISRVFSLFIVPSPFFVHCPYKGRIDRAESVLTGLKAYQS